VVLVKELLGMPEKKFLEKSALDDSGAIPNEFLPSDHIRVGVRVEVRGELARL